MSAGQSQSQRLFPPPALSLPWEVPCPAPIHLGRPTFGVVYMMKYYRPVSTNIQDYTVYACDPRHVGEMRRWGGGRSSKSSSSERRNQKAKIQIFFYLSPGQSLNCCITPLMGAMKRPSLSCGPFANNSFPFSKRKIYKKSQHRQRRSSFDLSPCLN